MMYLAIQEIHKCIALFDVFHDVYLFGSCLDKENPNDIDLLLIYDRVAMDDVIDAKSRIICHLEKETVLNLRIDVTMLSVMELEQTRFLDVSSHVKIK